MSDDDSDIPKDGNFTADYYDTSYFVVVNGKKFKMTDGSEGGWSYSNPTGEWLGCGPIVGAWKDLFKLDKDSKVLDVGCGRGTFIGYLCELQINAIGFDFSDFAVNNPYSRCNKERIIKMDATLPWIYGDKSFDLVIVLDLMEHLYLEDIDKVIDEMYRVARKWVFLQIATVPGGGSGSGIHDIGYMLKRGEKVPIELEGMTVAGHVTVQTKEFWIDRLMNKVGKGEKDGIIEKRKGWKLRDDLVGEFVKKVPADVIDNWIKNTMIILEKV